jgi:hypothetical protein
MNHRLDGEYKSDAFKTRGQTSSSPLREMTGRYFKPFTNRASFHNNSVNNIKVDPVYCFITKDKLQEELLLSKNKLNKKTKDFNALKVKFLKLEEENRKNAKLIQDIIEEATQNKKDDNIEELDVNNLNIMSLQRLKDVFS